MGLSVEITTNSVSCFPRICRYKKVPDFRLEGRGRQLKLIETSRTFHTALSRVVYKVY